MASRLAGCALAAALLLGSCAGRMSESARMPRLGQPADPAVIAREDIDAGPDGAGLPPGSGDAVHGRALFASSCAQCHGAAIELRPERWAYATTLFDYIRRAMPPTTRTKLDPDQVYALVAYLLATNGLADENASINASNLTQVRMPRVKDFLAPR
jgi:S-disulfanyl-L-cysteine oxidoreductase SoxD